MDNAAREHMEDCLNTYVPVTLYSCLFFQPSGQASYSLCICIILCFDGADIYKNKRLKLKKERAEIVGKSTSDIR